MKKLMAMLSAGVLIAIMALTSYVFADDCVGCDKVFVNEFVQYSVGTEIDLVLQRNVELSDLPGFSAKASSQNYDVFADVELGKVLILTPKIGLTTLQASSAIGSTDIDIESALGWNIGLDAEAKLLKTKYVDVSAIGGYKYTRVDEGNIDIGPISIDALIQYHQWELGGKLSKNLNDIWGNIPPVTPYVSIVYSDLVGDANVAILKSDIRAENKFGLRLGADITPIPNWTGGLEIKMIDQAAIQGVVKYKF